MVNDELLLSEIYMSMYKDKDILEENFFKNIANQFTKKNAAVIAAIAAIFATPGSKMHRHKHKPDEDKMIDAINRIGSIMSSSRIPSTTDYRDIFSDDDKIKEFIEDKQDQRFLISPRQFFTSRYGGNWQKVLDNARAYKAKNPDLVSWVDLSDEVLDMPIYVYIHSEPDIREPDMGGFWYEPDGTIHVFLPAVRALGGIGEVLDHEFKHTIQRMTQKQINKGVSTTLKGEYINKVDEVAVRLAKLVHLYYERTGNLITSPEEADRALEMFGFKPNATSEEIKKFFYIGVPEDVRQFRDIFYHVKEKDPADLNRLYELLRTYMPSVVNKELESSNQTKHTA